MTLKARFRLGVALGVAAMVAATLGIAHRFGFGFLAGVALGVFLGVGIVVGVVLLVARVGRDKMAQRLPPAKPHELLRWDHVMELRDLDGGYVYATSFRGRVLFLNFWATWCAPCIAEMPSIERLAAQFPDTDVVFACVTTEPAATVKAFLAKKNWKLPVYCFEGKMPESFDALSIPATFVVAPDGSISLRHMGAARWDSDESASFLRQIAASAPPTPRAPISRKDRLDWERRLPDIARPRTHWRILASGIVLADVSGDDLAAAIRVVESNVEKYRAIQATRVAIDASGACIVDGKTMFRIA